MILRRVEILEHERALVFKRGAFEGVLQPGVHWMLDPLFRLRVEVVSIRNGWLIHPDLELMVKSGRLGPEVRVVDLKTHERAIVWADGRLELVLKPGLYALWTSLRDTRSDSWSFRVLYDRLLERYQAPAVAGARQPPPQFAEYRAYERRLRSSARAEGGEAPIGGRAMPAGSNVRSMPAVEKAHGSVASFSGSGRVGRRRSARSRPIRLCRATSRRSLPSRAWR